MYTMHQHFLFKEVCIFMFEIIFSTHNISKNLVKTQISTLVLCALHCIFYLFVWRQLWDLCFFGAMTSVVALFYCKGVNVMADYKSMYYKLFNAFTDAIEILQKAQQETEDIYIDTSDDEENEEG